MFALKILCFGTNPNKNVKPKTSLGNVSDKKNAKIGVNKQDKAYISPKQNTKSAREIPGFTLNSDVDRKYRR